MIADVKKGVFLSDARKQIIAAKLKVMVSTFFLGRYDILIEQDRVTFIDKENPDKPDVYDLNDRMIALNREEEGYTEYLTLPYLWPLQAVYIW